MIFEQFYSTEQGFYSQWIQVEYHTHMKFENVDFNSIIFILNTKNNQIDTNVIKQLITSWNNENETNDIVFTKSLSSTAVQDMLWSRDKFNVNINVDPTTKVEYITF